MSRRQYRLARALHPLLLALAALTALAFAPPVLADDEVTVAEAEALDDWRFDPDETRVSAGQSVTWTNAGLELHTVTADDETFDSGLLDSGQRFQVRFSEPGVFRYACRLHPWMRGEVVVEEAATPRLYFGPSASPTFLFRAERVQVFQRFVLRQDAGGAVRPQWLALPDALPSSDLTDDLAPQTPDQ
jgi:plastocyanin